MDIRDRWIVGRVGWLVGWIVGRVGWLVGWIVVVLGCLLGCLLYTSDGADESRG